MSAPTTLPSLVADAMRRTGPNPLEVVGAVHAHGRANAGHPPGDVVAELFVLRRQELLDEVARQTRTEAIDAADLRQLLITRGVWDMNDDERREAQERARRVELEERRRAVLEASDHPESKRRQLLRFDPATREAEGLLLGGRKAGERMVKLRCPVCHRRDAWFFVAPERATWARCNHANTCGWAGPVWDLGA